MEGVLIFAALFIVFGPITIAIIALAKVSNTRSELDLLKRRLRRVELETAPDSTFATPKPKKVEPPPVDAAAPVRAETPPPVSRPAPEAPPTAPKTVAPKKAPSMGVEFFMGGRAAAFIGVGILVIGIALLVGYAIQNAWLGPGARVLLGLVCGLTLVGVGHWVGRLDEKYAVFSRVLTGGGSALFYFTVFAAYAYYDLIGAIWAGVGLFLCAAAVFGLAMFYGSLSVAILGVLGAFITPLLIGGEMDAGVFPLVYVALVNVPVLLLGVRRDWQSLYNLAFVFTVLHSIIWMVALDAGDFVPGLIFFLVFHAQFAALGLLKLRGEQQVVGRTGDLIRLILLSLFLPGMIYWLFEGAGHAAWTGLAFVLIGVAQFGVAALAYKTVTRFSGEITAFIAGGVFALAMALPVQFDGEWVSLGWAIEGAILAWFAGRTRSGVFRAGAFLLGLFGIAKVMLYDIVDYVDPPNLFLNARFGVGLLSAALLGAQGVIAARFEEDNEKDAAIDVAGLIAICAATLFFVSDVFWTVGFDEPLAWSLTTVTLFVMGAATLLFAPKRTSLAWLGCVLLIAAPTKALLLDSLLAYDAHRWSLDPFANRVFWTSLVVIAALIGLIQPLAAKTRARFMESQPVLPWLMNLTALGSALGLVSLEVWRLGTDWATAGVTLLWAVCALALILFGMRRRSAPHRYFGLVLVGLATLKALLVDSSELAGLQRIGAFIGTGVLLLLLAFAYQKASAFFESLAEEPK